MTTENSILESELFDFIMGLGQAPDGQLAESLSEECRGFDFDDKDSDGVVFLRNLLDKIVYVGGASEFVIKIITIMLDRAPEDEKEKTLRRKVLAKEFSM